MRNIAAEKRIILSIPFCEERREDKVFKCRIKMLEPDSDTNNKCEEMSAAPRVRKVSFSPDIEDTYRTQVVGQIKGLMEEVQVPRNKNT